MKFREWTINLVILFVTMILFFVFTEIIVARHYEKYFTLEEFNKLDEGFSGLVINTIGPNKEFRHYKYSSQLNSDGFRDRNFSLEKIPGTLRIAVVGDSFTFGQGIGEDKDTYPKQIESQISDEGIRAEVMNFGIPGANFLDIYWIFSRKVLKYNPDVLIYGFYINDIEFILNRNKLSPSNIDPRFCRLYRTKYIPYFVEYFDYKFDNMLSKKRHNDDYIREFDYYLKTLKETYYGWSCFNNILSTIAKISEENNIFPVIFIIPQIPNNIDANELNSKFSQQGINVIYNMQLYFQNETKNMTYESLRVGANNKDMHFNGIANRIIAEKIVDYLRSEYINSHYFKEK